MQVLIADDDGASRLMLEQMVKKLGHETLGAGDGEEGFKLFEQHDPRLVITDWMMPNVDGLELTRRIRRKRLPKYTYVILVTVKTGKWSFLEGMEAGVDDFLTKPIDVDELRARIRVAERILLKK